MDTLVAPLTWAAKLPNAFICFIGSGVITVIVPEVGQACTNPAIGKRPPAAFISYSSLRAAVGNQVPMPSSIDHWTFYKWEEALTGNDLRTFHSLFGSRAICFERNALVNAM